MDEKRVRILSDDDGHDYLIPVGLETEFQEWLEAGPYWENWTGDHFDQYRTGGSLTGYTFADPREEK